ncbi:MAG: hypothetical protein OXD33_14775, partial [Rhodobacteraceae bacterium]|nr:hypothetical protein [Paracoccaceae bacterium]
CHSVTWILILIDAHLSPRLTRHNGGRRALQHRDTDPTGHGSSADITSERRRDMGHLQSSHNCSTRRLIPDKQQSVVRVKMGGFQRSKDKVLSNLPD